jgi:hypothetical protein
MKKQLMTILIMSAAVAVAITTPVFAQESDGRQAVQPAAAKPAGQAPAELNAPREVAGSNNTNVKIELTITDQRSEGPAVVKTVTATVADRTTARIRTSGSVRTPMGGRDVVLNVDAGPSLVNVNGVTKLRLVLVIEYRPVAAESDTERTSTPSINEQLTVVLDDGRSLLVSQSADPSTDRKVKVEVKATILR